MANFFSTLMANAGEWMAQRVAGYLNDALGIQYTTLGSYYAGAQRKQLKTKMGANDDNVIQNFIGLAVNRSVSRLFKGGITFILPETSEQQQQLIDRLWDLNKKEILLYQVGLHGAVYGTYFFKISPDGVQDPYTGEIYPRLIALDPEITRIQTDPEDMNQVEQYNIEYSVQKYTQNGQIRMITRREITRRANEDNVILLEDGSRSSETSGTWVIEYWEQDGSGPWVLIKTTPWSYDFPPIIHGKNLPSLKSCYGDSDIDDAINVQDKSNLVVSNTGKIIKHHASPATVGTGFTRSDLKPLDDSPDNLLVIPDADAKVFNLEMGSDLASSRAFAQDLRQSIFDLSREIDISSMADKVGALTNFGLQVLWGDAIDKNDTKRQLYGDTILELNRRLLVLAGFVMEQSDPGKIQWGNSLPTNIKEDLEADQLALGMGIIDKATVAARYQSRYGKSWEEIQAALQNESTLANQNNADIGAQILRSFNRGNFAEIPQSGNLTPPNP